MGMCGSGSVRTQYTSGPAAPERKTLPKVQDLSTATKSKFYRKKRFVTHPDFLFVDGQALDFKDVQAASPRPDPC
jgi:hypothetical protein